MGLLSLELPSSRKTCCEQGGGGVLGSAKWAQQQRSAVSLAHAWVHIVSWAAANLCLRLCGSDVWNKLRGYWARSSTSRTNFHETGARRSDNA